MTKTLLLGLCLATAFLATACGGWDVKTDYDPDITFSTLKTYWISDHTKIPNDILAKEEIVRKRVVAAIEADLNGKGFTKATDEASADLMVLTYAGVKEMVNYSTIGYSYGGYWGYGSPGMYGTQVVENRYSEGTLHIDMFDVKKKMLAWKGQASGALQQARNPEERQAIIHEVVGATMKSFPPKSK